jgi:hypothetical protein
MTNTEQETDMIDRAFVKPAEAVQALQLLAKNPSCRVWSLSWRSLDTRAHAGRKMEN